MLSGRWFSIIIVWKTNSVEFLMYNNRGARCINLVFTTDQIKTPARLYMYYKTNVNR